MTFFWRKSGGGFPLKDKFKCEVGYSGHESTVSPSITAYFLGADYIERHIKHMNIL